MITTMLVAEFIRMHQSSKLNFSNNKKKSCQSYRREIDWCWNCVIKKDNSIVQQWNVQNLCSVNWKNVGWINRLSSCSCPQKKTLSNVYFLHNTIHHPVLLKILTILFQPNNGTSPGNIPINMDTRSIKHRQHIHQHRQHIHQVLCFTLYSSNLCVLLYIQVECFIATKNIPIFWKIYLSM